MDAKSDNGEILCEMIRIDEDLKRVIKEEQGISNELDCITYDIYDKIINEIKLNKIQIIFTNDIRYKVGDFNYDNFFGKTINIKYNYYNFITHEAYKLKFNRINYITRSTKTTLEITIYAICGTLQKLTFLNDLSHELEHIYQYTLADKNFADNDVYEYAIKLKDECAKNTLPYYIGHAIYLSRKYEQDAYANSLYSQLMNCVFLSDFEKTLYNSDAYITLQILKDHLNKIKHYKTFPTDLQKIGYTHHKFVKECIKAIDYMQRKIARVYNKATNDYRKKNGVEEKEIYESFVRFSIDMENKGGIPWQKL